nr:200 kDa antigen p200 [Tanacetum cinerariifolium]
MEVSFPSGSKIKIALKKIREVLGIPMGKKKLKSDSPREYDEEFLKAFKAQFHDKKYITITNLSKQIQRTTNTYFMFQMNYLIPFSNCMIHCDNSSRLIYYVIKDIKSTDIISDFDWCKFIWDHIKTSKNTWDNMTLENWYYRPNIVLMLIYLHYMKIDGLVMMQRKWPTIRNWTSHDVVDRENFKMSKGQIGLVEVIEDDDKEDENEKDAEKQKLREVSYL